MPSFSYGLARASLPLLCLQDQLIPKCDAACRIACSNRMQALAVPPAVLAFALSPRMCHAFMTTLSGLTGEALTDALRDLDAKKIPAWDAMSLPAPVLAHWGLPEGASMRSVLLVLRADVNARMVVNQGAEFQALSLVSVSPCADPS